MGALTVADTDALIDFFAGTDPMAGAVRALLEAGDLGVTTVSLFELGCGARRPDQQDDIRRLGQAAAVLPLDEAAAWQAAGAWRHLRRAGQSLATADLLIAGCCLAAGVRLLTRNASHFGRVPGLLLAPHPS